MTILFLSYNCIALDFPPQTINTAVVNELLAEALPAVCQRIWRVFFSRNITTASRRRQCNDGQPPRDFSSVKRSVHQVHNKKVTSLEFD